MRIFRINFTKLLNKRNNFLESIKLYLTNLGIKNRHIEAGTSLSSLFDKPYHKMNLRIFETNLLLNIMKQRPQW